MAWQAPRHSSSLPRPLQSHTAMGEGSRMQRMRNLDFFRKIPADLTQGTLSGAGLSILAATIMGMLFLLEFNSYLTVRTETRIEVDVSTDELLQINFNVSLPHLPCHLASVDVSDVTGTLRRNLTRNIRKWKLDAEQRLGREVSSDNVAPQYAEPDKSFTGDETFARALDKDSFLPFVQGNEVTLVNFFAPWCFWSRKLAPVWEQTAYVLSQSALASRVRLGKVDCTKPEAHALCHQNHINAFPTILIYKGGSTHSHEQYQGHRTPEAFFTFIRSLVTGDQAQAAKLAEEPVAETEDAEKRKQRDEHNEQLARVQQVDTKPAAKGGAAAPARGPEGCMIAGFVRVKRVPGDFHITASNEGYSFDVNRLNASHVVHMLTFGEPLEADQAAALRAAAESGPQQPRLTGQRFWTSESNTTFEHHIKVVPTALRRLSGQPVTAYKYTASSNQYETTAHLPYARFMYDLSPLSVVLSEVSTPLYHFLVNVCAIIGGVFTVLGLLDSVVYYGLNSLQKKVELGKAN